MDILFKNLLGSIQEFIKYCKLAPTKLTKKAMNNTSLTQNQLQWWREFIKELEENEKKLKGLLNKGIEANRNAIDAKLNFFRTLTRKMDANDGDWSTYYNDIRKNMKDIHCYLIDIDVKYNLDQI